IPAGGRRTIAVAFAPVLLGQRAGRLSILDNTNRAYTVLLRGLGLPPLAPEARLVPTSLVFGSQAIGTRSSPQSVTVANVGTAPLTIRGVGVTGVQAGEFVLVSGAEPIV